MYIMGQWSWVRQAEAPCAVSEIELLVQNISQASQACPPRSLVLWANVDGLQMNQLVNYWWLVELNNH